VGFYFGSAEDFARDLNVSAKPKFMEEVERQLRRDSRWKIEDVPDVAALKRES